MKKQTVEDKLDIIINMLGLLIGSNTEQTLMERIGLLKLAGVDNKTIAKILRTKESIVRASISQFLKKKTL